MDIFEQFDLEFYMMKALTISRQAVGQTGNNPPVGCILVENRQIIAQGLETIATSELFDYFEAYLATEEVDTILIGDPMGSSGSAKDISEKVAYLKKVLEKKYPDKEIILVDERFTSKMAQDTMHSVQAKKKKRQRKELLDMISATIILQSYMESQKK